MFLGETITSANLENIKETGSMPTVLTACINTVYR